MAKNEEDVPKAVRSYIKRISAEYGPRIAAAMREGTLALGKERSRDCNQNPFWKAERLIARWKDKVHLSRACGKPWPQLTKKERQERRKRDRELETGIELMLLAATLKENEVFILPRSGKIARASLPPKA